MNQAPFDTSTPGGSSASDDSGASGETRAASARRRPSRRSRATKPAAESAVQQSTSAAPAAPAPVAAPATPEAAAPAPPAASAEETPARTGERRGGRSRGGKRPAARGKDAPQLIITRPNESANEAAGESANESATSEPAGPVQPVAETVASAPGAAEASGPVVVPVVAAASGATQPAAPRKLRFGLPRRLQQPGTPPVIIAETTDTSATSEPTAAAPAEPAAAPEAAEAVEPAAESALARPRYRFDSTRRTASVGATRARPERLASQRPGLYTESPAPAESAAEPASPAASAAPTTPPAPVYDLPPLDALIGAGNDADTLPTFAFEHPAPAAAGATVDAGTGISETSEGENETEGEGADGEGAAGGRRRRRRRHSSSSRNGAHATELDESADEGAQPLGESDQGDLLDEALYGGQPSYAPAGQPEPLIPTEPGEPYYGEPTRATRGGYGEPSAPASGRGRNGRFGYSTRTPRPSAAPAQQQEPAWEPAAQQPALDTSPYGSPEPAYARGFGPTPSGVATPVRETYPRPGRVERGADATAASVAQLGVIMREAINTQTDRLLNELRRQQPPAVTVSIPNALSSERVGIFVDVANVVYSARGLRTSVDFGRLLDFLRANRRLARAQAYAPTTPEPGGEQAFLSAVKGLGYRITTKNYKTFANGAKKADLDLDLCMDIVRIVEARAVDTIVLVSGDSDFLPLLDYCSDHGVRVEVAAFDDAASMILRQSCDLFVNLSLVDGIRG